MEMKKILGILLAVCFLMSVTAAAVSAGTSENKWNGNKDKKDDNKKDDRNKKDDEKKWGDDKKKDDGKKWGDDRHKKVEYKWKCHTEYKRVLVKIIYKHHGKPIKIYKWKAFKVCKKVPVYGGHR